jgi:multidrug resistance efflux pump
MQKVWVTTNFKEDQLERMRVAERVELAVDAYFNLKLCGNVDGIRG